MAVLRRRLRTGNDLQSAAAVRAVFDVDVEDPFEQPGPAHGYVPQYLYDRAGIDTSLPFEELKRRSRVNPAAQAANQAPGFSQRSELACPIRQSLHCVREMLLLKNHKGAPIDDKV